MFWALTYGTFWRQRWRGLIVRFVLKNLPASILTGTLAVPFTAYLFPGGCSVRIETVEGSGIVLVCTAGAGGKIRKKEAVDIKDRIFSSCEEITL